MKHYTIQIKHTQNDMEEKHTNCYISAWNIAEECSQDGYENVAIYDNIKKTIVAEDWQGKTERPPCLSSDLQGQVSPNYHFLDGY